MNEFVRLILGLLQGIGASTGFVLVMFVGFCVLFGLRKLKPRGRHAGVVRDLDERLGTTPVYLPADAPRGPADQLQTPELLEAAARKTA